MTAPEQPRAPSRSDRRPSSRPSRAPAPEAVAASRAAPSSTVSPAPTAASCRWVPRAGPHSQTLHNRSSEAGCPWSRRLMASLAAASARWRRPTTPVRMTTPPATRPSSRAQPATAHTQSLPFALKSVVSRRRGRIAIQRQVPTA
eukprot:4439993-Prymnesium_polylepis.2